MQDNYEPLVNKKDLAEALSLSTRSVENLVRLGRIPMIAISSKCVRFQLGACLAALAEHSPLVDTKSKTKGATAENMAKMRAARKKHADGA